MATTPTRNRYTSLRGVVITAPWLLKLLLADVILSLLLPVSLAFPTTAYNVSSRIAESIWASVQDIFTISNGAKITFAGDKLSEGESAIVVANHVAWTDFYMIQELARKANMLGRCRWFAKSQLKWVPFLGWGLWAMGMPLVTRRWVQDKQELERVFGGIRKNKWPIWLISYSEATRFTAQKYEEAVAWCKANDKPIPKHTLYPRTRGFIAQVQELRRSEHVEAVYDCTIAYATGKNFMQAPTMWQSLSMPDLSPEYQFHVHVDRHLLRDLPQDDQALAQWLEARWIEKGERLEEWRDRLAQTGHLDEKKQ